jgi:hypothetical protein
MAVKIELLYKVNIAVKLYSIGFISADFYVSFYLILLLNTLFYFSYFI